MVDWFEVWTRDYWREYLGRAGTLGWLVQLVCVRVSQRVFCFSRLHAGRLRAEGLQREPTVLTGMYDGPLDRPRPEAAELVVVFAGRHIPEKRVPSLVSAMAVARRRVPKLRCEIFGDGPERPKVEALVKSEGLSEVVRLRGFASAGAVKKAVSRALCLVLPSRREGYGQVVVEAAASGVPSVVCAAPDNAAVELVDDGRNGVIAASDEPDALAAAIMRVYGAGPPLREATADWFAENAQRLSLRQSLDVVAAEYAAERA